MQDWASLHGIDHQRTAPYTSTQNRCAEHLHRMLLGKAQAMHLSCNAPTSFWAKFCTTTTYLSNLTLSSSLNGKTPYEIWTRCIPSLSHLCKIGCHAFTLIQMHNPKIYRCSCPCILIGYTPHAKAYQLWDTVDGSIFNSFHVTFLEHLDEQPTDLLPGTTICIEPNTAPSWDAPPCSVTPPPIQVPSTSSPSSPTLPLQDGKNHQHVMLSSSSTSNSPGENRPVLMPGSDHLDHSSSSPSLRRSSHSHAPSSRLAMDDNLLPSHCLSETISDSASAAAHQHLS